MHGRGRPMNAQAAGLLNRQIRHECYSAHLYPALANYDAAAALVGAFIYSTI